MLTGRMIQTLSYGDLSSVLQMSTVRELEDLIIESVYLGLLSGKLNQAKKVFEVAEVSGRDVRVSDISSMLATLTNWQSSSAHVMENIHERIVAADQDRQRAAKEKTDRERAAEEKFNIVRITLENEPDGGRKGAFDMDQFAATVLMGSRKGKNRPGRHG